jgi:hypothetical protein
VVYPIPSGVKVPVFLKTVAGLEIVDAAVAHEYWRLHVASKAGRIFRMVSQNGVKFSADLPVYKMRSASGAVSISPGESARLRPSNPTHGPVMSSGYARRLDAFVSGNSEAIQLFKSRKTPRHKGGVAHESPQQPKGRSILYFPHEGITKKTIDDYVSKHGVKRRGPSKIREIGLVRGSVDSGFDILDGNDWVIIDTTLAVKMLESGEAILK